MGLSRRQILRVVGASSLGTLAGCNTLTDGDRRESTPDGADLTTEIPTRTPTTSLTPTSTQSSGSGSASDNTPVPESSSGETTTPVSTPAPLPETESSFKITATDGELYDKFGASVALSTDGETAIVGSIWDDIQERKNDGSAYIFEDNNGWKQQTKLTAADNRSGSFGHSVAMSSDGKTVLIGATYNESGGRPAGGCAYIFTDDGGWSQESKIVAEDGDARDEFGYSVALSADGTTALIGAPGDEDPNGSTASEAAGSAYIFSGTTGWSQKTKLAADGGYQGARFGDSVALSADGSTALVGARLDTEPNGERSGSAHVFTETGGWSRTTKISANDGDPHDHFGGSVDLSPDGDTALIGAWGDKGPNEDIGSGSAYLFTDSNGWSQQAKLTATDGDPGDRFGYAVSLSVDGTRALIGARLDSNPNGQSAGSAYLFTKDESWNQRAKLVAPDGDEDDRFGTSTAMSSDGNEALVGADQDERQMGSAYVFE